MIEDASMRWKEVVSAEDSPALCLELLRRYVRDYAENAGAWSCLGLALMNLSQFEEAERALLRSIEMSSPAGHLSGFFNLGTLFREKGDDVSAESWFRKAIDHSPDNTQGYIGLGALFARRGRLAEAEELHRRASRCKTGCIDEAYHNLGLVLRGQGRYEEALRCFVEALKIDPQFKAARLAKRDVQHAIAAVM